MAGAQVTIWHNPRCGNSRGALQLLRVRRVQRKNRGRHAAL